jgi:hypothetical protein
MACFLLILIAGCSSTGKLFQEETALDKNWGRSVETAKYNQIIDPEAGKNLKPVEGLSGNAAGNSVDKYEKSFKEKATEQSTATTTIQK